MSLTKLIEAVEAGEWPGQINGIARAVFPYNEDWRKDHGVMAHEAFDGSLDAAKRLHDALLPEWRVEFFNLDGEVILGRNRPINRTYGDAMNSGEVARAWLLAILRALEEEGR